MTGPADCQLIGRWRIVEADLWDRDHLDLVEPAFIAIKADGHGEIAFGAMNAGLDLEYARTIVFFTWFGFDEMDEVSSIGFAELLEGGSLEIEFRYYLGDEAVLKARRARFFQQPSRPRGSLQCGGRIVAWEYSYSVENRHSAPSGKTAPHIYVLGWGVPLARS